MGVPQKHRTRGAMNAITFTGEYFVPGGSGIRIEADHMARYEFAADCVAGKSALDIACGVGYACPLLLGAGAVSYHGVDIQPTLIEHARSKYSDARAKFEIGD